MQIVVPDLKVPSQIYKVVETVDEWIISSYLKCHSPLYFYRYLSIVKEEGLEISQPALDPGKSEVHHPITVRRQRSRSHRLDKRTHVKN